LTGLTVANLCQDVGDVIILEQNNTLYSEKHDGGFSLGPWGQKIFELHIPAPDLLEHTIRCERLLTVQPNGDSSPEEPLAKDHHVRMTSYFEVYRALLRGIGVESENNRKVENEARSRLRLGSKVEGAQYKNGSWTITYYSTATNRVETETADILVAADGANSTVRGLTSSDGTPNYEKVVAWRGRVPDKVFIDNDKKIKEGLIVWYKMRGFQYIIL
jgi:2-polyprenyl-6-methoxyphenol hydroxylase-like FAD-dependent oxidoreductase